MTTDNFGSGYRYLVICRKRLCSRKKISQRCTWSKVGMLDFTRSCDLLPFRAKALGSVYYVHCSEARNGEMNLPQSEVLHGFHNDLF